MPGGKNLEKLEADQSQEGSTSKTQTITFGGPVSKRTRSRITKSLGVTTKPQSDLNARPVSTKSAGDRGKSKVTKSAKFAKAGSAKSPPKLPTSAKSNTTSRSRKHVRKVQAPAANRMTTCVPEPMEIDDSVIFTGMSKPATTTAPPVEEADNCSICMSEMENPKKLDKCGHEFCTECIDQCFAKMNPICPICGTVYGNIVGNMPQGTMKVYYQTDSQLEGYHGCGIIIIEYIFPDGKQTQEHPHPGKRYYGTHRVAYLPDNEEGRRVLSLLRRAFDSRMTFTVGRSATTGLDDQVIWNDIHHKTRTCGGSTAFGYPDATYLSRVTQELASKGIK